MVLEHVDRVVRRAPLACPFTARTREPRMLAPWRVENATARLKTFRVNQPGARSERTRPQSDGALPDLPRGGFGHRLVPPTVRSCLMSGCSGSAMSCGSLWWRPLRWSSGKCADHYTREHTTPLELLAPDPCYAWQSFTIYSCGKLNQIAVLIGFFKVHISVRV